MSISQTRAIQVGPAKLAPLTMVALELSVVLAIFQSGHKDRTG
jgi:hypothetical protein